jgi:hypothetical protein
VVFVLIIICYAPLSACDISKSPSKTKDQWAEFCQVFYAPDYFSTKYLTFRPLLLEDTHAVRLASCDNADHLAKHRMDTITYRARINPIEIGFLNSIIESYDGIAVVRTLHGTSGIVELWIAPDFEDIVNAIMHDLADEIGLHYLYKATQRLSS